MEDERDYYAILGVPADAPDVDIRRAFRARAKELHPDSKPPSEREQAHREFNFLSEAYDTLKDAERRAAYDEELKEFAPAHPRRDERQASGGFRHGARIRPSPRWRRYWRKAIFGRGAEYAKEPGFPESYQSPADTGSSARSIGKNGPGRARRCDGSLPGGR